MKSITKGITGISKTGTSGLVDTYTITYNDGSTSTFTVTNGAKGDTGDSWYVWIRYSGSQPTQDSDMGTTPDNWMGIYSGTSSTAPVHYTDYDWFQIKGEKGDKGDAATVVSQSVTYQEGTSPNVQPSGTWTTTIPVVSQGNYLWTRTIVTFNSGNPVTFYSVARMGLDGTGSVSSVNNQSPDSNGNVTVTASDIGTTDSTSVQSEINGVKNTLNQLDAEKADETSLALRRTGTTNTGAQIATGTFFYLDGTLKRAIATIAQSASFTAQNCETVTAGGLNEFTAVITGTITKDQRITTGTLQVFNLIKVGNLVFGAARIYGMSNISAAGNFFNLPDGFRPSINVYTMGYASIDGVGDSLSVPISIMPSGIIDFSYSATKQVSQIGFAGCWSII